MILYIVFLSDFLSTYYVHFVFYLIFPLCIMCIFPYLIFYPRIMCILSYLILYLQIMCIFSIYDFLYMDYVYFFLI